MANVFLNDTDLMSRDLDTALLLEKATIFDIGKAVAYTDGRKIYVNTEDNLNDILPAYDQRFLKWILWHEKMHMELRHHERFFKYLKELELIGGDLTAFTVTKDEVNIIMDILVHDSLSKMFPELVENAIENLAQMRNRNSLKYTFKTNTLEEMLTEYAEHKKDESGDSTETEKGTDSKETSGEDETEEGKSKTKEVSHGAGGDGISPDAEEAEEESEQKDKMPDEHDKTDWSKLDDLDDKEFITKEEAEEIDNAIARIRRTKIKLGKLTETINGLVTTTRKRSYTMPSLVHAGGNIIMKGSTPGRTQLYFIFDASGSMSEELDTFKDIMKKSVPQAMDLPCEWFAGWGAEIKPYEKHYDGDYYKGKFKDIIPVYASNGFSDDGDRTIELCWKAEQLGYSPIGVTDGGGQLEWSKDKLKQLKRTVLVGHRKYWLDKCKEINPTIQIIDI